MSVDNFLADQKGRLRNTKCGCQFIMLVQCTWTIGGQFFKNQIFLLKFFYLKGQSNEIFDPQFFSSFEPAWATDQWVKTVSLLVLFSPRYSYFSIEKTDSAQYHTARSQNNLILDLNCENEKFNPLIEEYESIFIFVTLSL